MKKLILIFVVCALLICTSCGKILNDIKPPLSDTGESDAAATPSPGGTTAPDPGSTGISDVDGLYLEISGEKYAAGEKIKYTYINNTDAAVNILSIPHLEQKTSGGWVEVPFCDGVGFCGTPDSIAANSRSLEWELDTETLYGGALVAGIYKLSLSIVDDKYDPVGAIQAEFEVA